MNAIDVRDVRKTYRRYGRRSNFGTLKSAILSGGVARDLRADEAFEALRRGLLWRRGREDLWPHRS